MDKREVFNFILKQMIEMCKSEKEGNIRLALEYKKIIKLNCKKAGYSQECVDTIKAKAYRNVYKAS